jgi:hypothetical protein
MYLDALALFSNAQAVTATAASTDSMDLSQIRDIGVGEDLYIFCNVDVAMTDSSSNTTITVTLETDDNSGFSSATTTQTLFVFPALSAVGAIRFARIQPLAMNERFAQLRYTVANGDLTTGSFTAGIIHGIDAVANYASGFAVIR